MSKRPFHGGENVLKCRWMSGNAQSINNGFAFLVGQIELPRASIYKVYSNNAIYLVPTWLNGD